MHLTAQQIIEKVGQTQMGNSFDSKIKVISQVGSILVITEKEETIVQPEGVMDIVELKEEADILVLSEVGPQGPQGEPGVGGNATDVVYPAGEAIGGHRCVVVGSDGKVYYASQQELTHMNKVLGITTGAVAMGANATIRAFGEMTEPSWNWTLDKPIFLGLNGLLTQTPPTTGFSLIIAFPTSATKIFVEIKDPILLG